MKHGKKPNVTQRMALAAAGLEWQDWLIERELPNVMIAVNRETGAQRVIEK